MKRKSESGVALIVTLILLTIITVIAVAFLAVTGRERAQVGMHLNSIDAEYSADAGYQRAIAVTLMPIIFNTNLYDVNLRVSQNYQNPIGVDLGAAPSPPILTNVNYEYDTLGSTYITNYNSAQWHDFYQNVIGGNLSIDPRVPVFVNTNKTGLIPEYDFRYYLDLNRSGKFEPTGSVLEHDRNGGPMVATLGGNRYVSVVGDPQWIGILQFPNQHHSSSNKFIGRYAYLIVPAGKTLDINYVGNQARYFDIETNNVKSGYLRNQGHGSWELNVPALLTDLNTNYWNQTRYSYDPTPGNFNVGEGFTDAALLLNHRFRMPESKFGYGLQPYPQDNLPTALQVFGNNSYIFTNDQIDFYPNNPLGGLSPLNFGQPFPVAMDLDDDPTQHWTASESKQHFSGLIEDMFGPASQDFPPFRDRIAQASRDLSTQGRHTYYRLLDMLGTDSVPAPDGFSRTDPNVVQINLNYQNLGTDANGTNATSTGLMPWRPIDFFTNVADVLLRAEFTNFGVGRIPVYTNNSSRYFTNNYSYPVFTPRVRQLLQIAANIYDASTNSPFPSIFRPQYQVTNNEVYITNFVEETNAALVTRPWRDLDDSADLAALQPDDNVYNISVIIGAKKNVPNFNRYSSATAVLVTRKLQFLKRSVNDPFPYTTNQMFEIGISNMVGLDAWNSYTNALTSPSGPRIISVRAGYDIFSLLTNSLGSFPNLSPRVTTPLTTTPVTNWPARKFIVPPITNHVVLGNSAYYATPTSRFEPIGENQFETNPRAFTNKWGLNITNRVRFFIVDSTVTPPRILDAVGLCFNSYFDISKELDAPLPGSPAEAANLVWDQTPVGTTTRGVLNQILVSSRGPTRADSTVWSQYSQMIPNSLQVQNFRDFLGTTRVQSTNVLAPFVPVRKMWQTNKWEVNDPLVHYTKEDLLDSPSVLNRNVATVPYQSTVTLGLGTNVSTRYRPWGQRGNSYVEYNDMNDFYAFNAKIKDPGVTQTDDFQFPTNKYANLGNLGRVHRGTPWQTLYFKAFTNEANYTVWSNNVGLAFMPDTHPTNDWKLADYFTVAIHPNATRGRHSINQTNAPAWSAVLSGVGVTTLEKSPNGPAVLSKNVLIEPEGNGTVPSTTNTPIFQIIESINDMKNRQPGRQFTKLGQVLAAPKLTSLSPFLNQPFLTQAADAIPAKRAVLTDLDYERIPDQILSLLKVGELRFVIYSFGQSLKPASSYPGFPSVVTSGPNSGMVVNYQITGEVATRTVVRIEFERVTDRTSPDYGQLDYRKPHAVVESFNILPPN